MFCLPNSSYNRRVLSPLRTCPGVADRMEELVDLYGTGTVLDMYKQQLKFWSLNSGIPIQNWNDVVSLYRILYAEDCLAISADYLESLQFYHGFGSGLRVADIHTGILMTMPSSALGNK
ncbi:hypothetical protein TNCV_3813571 [Trichonephila clavipes]|nr:hypothetical protein TNCV_3813571 [Trichonephila clavipes]